MAERPTRRATRSATKASRDDARAEQSSFSSGFATLREVLSYVLGAAVLIYGVTFAEPDRAYLVVGAGLALLGSPIVGSIFDRKDKG